MEKSKTKELAIVKEINPLVLKIRNVKITSPKIMSEASEYLSQVNRYLDKLTADKEKLTKPLNAAIKEVRERYKPTELILQGLIQTLRNEMSSYQTKQISIQKKEEEKILAKVESGSLGIEKASEKMSSISTPDKRVESASGSVSFIATKKLKITNEELIPKEYYTLNESLCLAHLKLGKSVPGCEIEVVQIPRNSR